MGEQAVVALALGATLQFYTELPPMIVVVATILSKTP